MLSFQTAGALLLLLNTSNGHKEAIIKNCFPGSNIVQPNDDGMCVIPKEKIQKSAHTIHLNILAFLDLIIGYLIAAFSPSAHFAGVITALLVVGCTALLCIGEYYGSRYVGKKIYDEDEVVPYQDLKQNGVDSVATDKEVSEMLDEVMGVQEDSAGG
jgi:hypothetical protein